MSSTRQILTARHGRTSMCIDGVHEVSCAQQVCRRSWWSVSKQWRGGMHGAFRVPRMIGCHSVSRLRKSCKRPTFCTCGFRKHQDARCYFSCCFRSHISSAAFNDHHACDGSGHHCSFTHLASTRFGFTLSHLQLVSLAVKQPERVCRFAAQA